VYAKVKSKTSLFGPNILINTLFSNNTKMDLKEIWIEGGRDCATCGHGSEESVSKTNLIISYSFSIWIWRPGISYLAKA
jgi:hypothetical protein